MRQIRTFISSASGAITVGFLVLVPGFILIGGIAIDISVLNAQRKFVQSQADLAAVSGIHNMESPESVYHSARDTILSEVFFDMATPSPYEVQLGQVDSQFLFQRNANQDSLENVSAIRTIASSPAQMPILGQLLTGPPPIIRREAVAVAEPTIGFSLSNCLLSLNLLNGLVEPLVGADADLLCSGHGLRVNAVQLLDELSLQMTGVTPGTTYGDVLDAHLELGTIVDTAMRQAGLGMAAAAGAYVDEVVQLNSFLHLTPELKQVTLGSDIAPLQVRVDDIVFGAIEVLGEHIVDLDLDLNLGPFAHVPAKLTISDPRKVVLGARPGDPGARAETAQIRLEVDDVSIAGLFSLSVKLGVANAEATLAAEGEHCAMHPDLRAAVFDPVEAELLDVELGLTLLGLPLGSHVDPTREHDLTHAVSQEVIFSHAEVEDSTIKGFEPVSPEGADNALGALTGGVSDMLSAVHQDLETLEGGSCTGLLGCTLAGLSQTLNSLINDLGAAVFNTLNGTAEEGHLLNAVLDDLLGIGLAEAQLQVVSVECTRRLGG